MAQRSIEEVFRQVAPTRKGIPGAPVIATGLAGNGGEVAQSMSQAAQEIAQLRAAYQQQSALITANTQAVQGNTAAQGSHSAGAVASGIASHFLGGLTGVVGPLISGISRLFGGGPSAPAALPTYTPPQSVSIDAILHAPGAGLTGAGSGTATDYSLPRISDGSAGGDTRAPVTQGSGGVATSYAPVITVNINAMDSQSFMDRSGDIANAVREAMLNNHPINSVVSEL